MIQNPVFRIVTALSELYAQLPASQAEPGICPNTGFGFDPAVPKDRRLVSRLCSEWSDAEAHFGLPLLSARHRDAAISLAMQAVLRCASLSDQVNCAEVLVAAGYFSRSLIGALDRSVLGRRHEDWRNHADLATYLPHVLAANRRNPQFADRLGGPMVFAALVDRYGNESRTRIRAGETYWPME